MDARELLTDAGELVQGTPNSPGWPGPLGPTR
jgi:hypothetical protein